MGVGWTRRGKAAVDPFNTVFQQKGGKDVDLSSVKSSFLSLPALGSYLTCQQASGKYINVSSAHNDQLRCCDWPVPTRRHFDGIFLQSP